MVKKLCADRGGGRNIGISETRRTKNTKIIPPKRYKEETHNSVENRKEKRNLLKKSLKTSNLMLDSACNSGKLKASDEYIQLSTSLWYLKPHVNSPHFSQVDFYRVNR